jgi:hypothetical protein
VFKTTAEALQILKYGTTLEKQDLWKELLAWEFNATLEVMDENDGRYAILEQLNNTFLGAN